MTNSDVLVIEAMTRQHWSEVQAIYAAGIATGHATFESEPPDWDRFELTRLPGHRHVALDTSGRVIGWTAVTPVSSREAYAGVVEDSVYVDPVVRGRGIGRLLLDRLIASTEEAGIWTIQSGIFPENTVSLAVHEAAGFRVVGVRERMAKMTYGPRAQEWRDIVFVERRSPRIR